MLERLDGQWFCAEATGRREPVLEFRTDVSLAAGDTRELWFRFGIDDGSQAGDPAASMRGLSDRLPRENAAYSMVIGFNGASRDPLQHALPQVYSEPGVVLSVLRNLCAWASADGALDCAR
jgi:hypothetical protein